MCNTVSYMCNTVSYMCNTVSYMCNTVSYMCNTVSYMCNTVSYMCNTVSYMCNTVSYMCNTVSYMCNTVSYMCNVEGNSANGLAIFSRKYLTEQRMSQVYSYVLSGCVLGLIAGVLPACGDVTCSSETRSLDNKFSCKMQKCCTP